MAPDVYHRRRNVSLQQRVGDEKPAVAARRIFFAAHHGHTSLRRTIEQALQTLGEALCLSELAVEDLVVVVVQNRLRGPAAQLTAQEHIAETGLGQQLPQCRLPEVRREPTVRL